MRSVGVKWGASLASIAVVASAFGVPTSANADGQTSTDAQSKVDSLLKERDALKKKIEKERFRVDNVVDDIEARRLEASKVETEVNNLKKALSTAALAQYQSGPRDAALLTTNDPGEYLSKLSTMTQVESNLNKQLQTLSQRQAYATNLQRSLEVDSATSKETIAGLMDLQKQSDAKLEEAEKVASTMKAEERAAVERRLANERPAGSPAPAGNDKTSRSNGREGSVPAGSAPTGTSSGNLYAWGNCTWYSYERRLQLGRPIGGTWGNAYSWAGSARAAGFTVSSTPIAGAVFQSGGHVGVVERVNGDGTVYVSEMNWYGNGGGYGKVSYRTAPVSFGVYIY